MRRDQLDWLLSPQRGARDLSEVGVLWMVLVPVAIFAAVALLHWITT